MNPLDRAREALDIALTSLSKTYGLDAYQLLGLLDVAKQDIHDSVRELNDAILP